MSLTGFATIKSTGNLVEAEKTTHVPITLKVAALEVATTVTGETPIVDPTNQTQQTRLRVDEFEKMPLGRNYQTLMGQAPGVVGTGNVNAHGALSSNNLFMFDGVNTTDPTTGTFGANLNYESIQEILMRTASVSAEFGRATGAIVDVITKSGTNQLKGSFKCLFTNDNWNEQNSTRAKSPVPTGRSRRSRARSSTRSTRPTADARRSDPPQPRVVLRRLRGRAGHEPADAAQRPARRHARELPADDEVAVPERCAARCS